MGRRAIVFAALVTTVALIVGLLVIVNVSTADAAADCSKPLVVGARGVGQNGSDSDGGYGPEIAEAMGKFVDAYGQGPVDGVPLDYPAASVATLLDNQQRFLDTFTTGVANLKLLLSVRAKECPDQFIALFGYSEGALVVHEALLDLSVQITRRIRGVGLLADPVRIGTDTYNIGSASSDFNGIGLVRFPGVGVVFPADPVPSLVQPITQSLCDAGDPICAFNPASFVKPTLPQTVLAVIKGVDTHEAYVSNGGAATLGTNVGLIARLPTVTTYPSKPPK